MTAFKGTKGIFSDGHTGWKIGERETNGVQGFEIHWSDDGECVTDHVYTLEDAKLIASAPDLLEALQELVYQVEQFTLGNINEQEYFRFELIQAKEAINKAAL